MKTKAGSSFTEHFLRIDCSVEKVKILSLTTLKFDNNPKANMSIVFISQMGIFF